MVSLSLSSLASLVAINYQPNIQRYPLVAREELPLPLLFGFSEFPKDLVKESVLDGPRRDATRGSALVKSSQEKVLSMYRHSHTYHRVSVLSGPV